MPSIRQDVAGLRLLSYRGKRPDCAGDNELGVAAALRGFVQDCFLGRRPVRIVQQGVAVVGGGSDNPVELLSVPPTHAQAVLEPLQGHLVDCLCRTRRDPLVLSRSACRRR